jgi:DNA topoisomerase VI subunit A
MHAHITYAIYTHTHAHTTHSIHTHAAKFILLVEKDAAFMRLAEDRFYNTYPCVIITAKGQVCVCVSV